MYYAKISKGKHSATEDYTHDIYSDGPLPRFRFFIKEIEVTYLTNASWLYTLEENQGQVNKVIGFNHDIRAAFVGDAHPYFILSGTYVGSNGFLKKKDAKFYPDKMLAPNLPCQLLYVPTKWWQHIFTYVNNPYFGGKVPAPHDMYFAYELKTTYLWQPLIDKIKNYFKKK